MGRDLDVLDQGGIAPDAEAVIGESRAADDLLVASAPPQACDLGSCVDAVGASAGGRVPEMDLTIVAPAASGKEVRLPWAPG